MEEMKTSGMVERVARALHTVDDARSRPDLAVEWEACLPVYQKMKLEEARAAIDAMREPTEAMMDASNREWDGRMSYRSSGAWRAMVDAALSEPQP